jgi:hypothetical protein
VHVGVIRRVDDVERELVEEAGEARDEARLIGRADEEGSVDGGHGALVAEARRRRKGLGSCYFLGMQKSAMLGLALLSLALGCRRPTEPGVQKAVQEPREAPRAAGSAGAPDACEGGPIKPPPNAATGRYRVRGFTADATRTRFYLEPKSGGQNTVEVSAASPGLEAILLRSEGTGQILELAVTDREGCVGEVVFARTQ